MSANRYFVLAGLLVTGTSAHAAPGHRKPAADAPADADARAGADTPKRLAESEPPAAPTALEDSAESQPRPPAPGWTFAIGPYVWASSVQADVSFGPLNTGVEIGFVSLVRHTRYGAEMAFEARRGRFGISGDIMYGKAAVGGSTEIASVMTSIAGEVGSLMMDGAVSYAVIGGDAAPFTLEARSGVRYQRNAVQGELGVAGFTVPIPEFVDDGADLYLGARAALRATRSVVLAGSFDVGVVGASDSTRSFTLDASLRVASWLSLAAGWRSLTMNRSYVSIELSGPRVAAQLLF